MNRFWIGLPESPFDLDAFERLEERDQQVFRRLLAFVASDAENVLSDEFGQALGMRGAAVLAALGKLREAGLVTVRGTETVN